jgi:hypothetical protein
MTTDRKYFDCDNADLTNRTVQAYYNRPCAFIKKQKSKQLREYALSEKYLRDVVASMERRKKRKELREEVKAGLRRKKLVVPNVLLFGVGDVSTITTLFLTCAISLTC